MRMGKVLTSLSVPPQPTMKADVDRVIQLGILVVEEMKTVRTVAYKSHAFVGSTDVAGPQALCLTPYERISYCRFVDDVKPEKKVP